ncbi:MAG: hypothetical protein ACO1OB_33415 [Archangium sp.]
MKRLSFSERVALFVTTLHREHSDTLLSGFATESQQRATQFAAQVKKWDSGQRQARLTHEFGVSPDAADRLKQVVVGVDGVLRAAVVASLPPAVRQQYPQFKEEVESFPEVVKGLAARLVREAGR